MTAPLTTTRLNTTSQPLVSIIVPTHNYGTLISETLISAAPRFTRWECIIIDDDSTDEIAEFVAQICETGECT